MFCAELFHVNILLNQKKVCFTYFLGLNLMLFYNLFAHRSRKMKEYLCEPIGYCKWECGILNFDLHRHLQNFKLT